MIVLIAGMQRSGSTFSFNVVRELLAARGSTATIATNSTVDALEEGGACDHLIIKSHVPDQLADILIRIGAIKCICTIRKPQDAISSWMHVFGFNLLETVAMIKQWLRWHEKICEYVLNIGYENVDRYPVFAVYRICRYVVRDASIAECLKIWWRYRKSEVKKRTDNLSSADPDVKDIGFSYYDKDSFFHRRHISVQTSKRAEDLLSGEELSYIRSELRDLTDSVGNYNWRSRAR